MKNFIHSGKKLTVKAPYDLVSGDLLILNELVGIAIVDAKKGDEVTVSTHGVYELAKDTIEVSEGEKAHFNMQTKSVGLAQVETDEGDEESSEHKQDEEIRPIGFFVENASSEAKKARVKLV